MGVEDDYDDDTLCDQYDANNMLDLIFWSLMLNYFISLLNIYHLIVIFYFIC